jgi:uncharacterized membrane protein YgcG
MWISRLFRRLALVPVVLCGILSGPLQAEESIENFRSDILVHGDGLLTVSEAIEVWAEGSQIKRGIYRDFPLTFTKDDGSLARVDFSVVGVEIDGETGAWHQESIPGGTRVYMGEAEHFLDHGRHVFVLNYETNRQIRYFQDHDELYWNVTGNQWVFPIKRASAEVTLPEGARILETDLYTGAMGEQGQDGWIEARRGGVTARTTRPLAPGEGLTIAVALPKGVLLEPDDSQKTLWFLRDTINYWLGFGILTLVLLYYLWAWNRVGRDPHPDVMVPRWTPPEGLSPAVVNYVEGKGFRDGGWTAMTASLLDLGVKGYLTLDNREKRCLRVTRSKREVSRGDLPPGQRVIMRHLGDPGEVFEITKDNSRAVDALHEAFIQAIEKEHRGLYYTWNRGYVVAGVVLSVVLAIAALVLGPLGEVAVFMAIPLAMIGGMVSIIVFKARSLLRKSLPIGPRIFLIVVLCVLGYICAQVVGLTLSVMVADDGSIPVSELVLLGSVGGLAVLNVLFGMLMGAPTPLGVTMTAQVEGLRTYLEMAERDRMNMAGPPELTPRHFETLLPYAVALSVEKPWSDAFRAHMAAIQAATAAAAAAYSPDWYGGNEFNMDRLGKDMTSLSSSMANTMRSSLPDPPSGSSSGSGGGGSSGGGGGGGGGGGW